MSECRLTLPGGAFLHATLLSDSVQTVSTYDRAELIGVVGYKQLYPDGGECSLDDLLSGLQRVKAINLVFHIQRSLVGKLFYNPDFVDERTFQIDVPRFFFGASNLGCEQQDVIRRYKIYVERRWPSSKWNATNDEAPLILLKYIMSMPEGEGSDDDSELESKLFKALLIANEISLNKNQEGSQNQSEDTELQFAKIFIAQYACNDFLSDKEWVDSLLCDQYVRARKFFDFILRHPKFKPLYEIFLREYNISSWKCYVLTYLNILAAARYKTGFIDFERQGGGFLSECVVSNESVCINKIIPLEDNVNCQAFREKPFIRIESRRYFVTNISLVVRRMFDGLYFIFKNLWVRGHPDGAQWFNTTFTTEFSEKKLFTSSLNEISDAHGLFRLTDDECRNAIPEKKLSAPPDFYIRFGNSIILFECKDIRINKDVVENRNVQKLLLEIDKSFLGYQDAKKNKWRYKGVGQLVRNAKRIQSEEFAWDGHIDKQSEIFLVLVVSDVRCVGFGWQNYLNRRMYEECIRQGVNCDSIRPLILISLGSLLRYKGNFKKYGFVQYFKEYYACTSSNKSSNATVDPVTSVMNRLMSFDVYMNGKGCLDDDKLLNDFMNNVLTRDCSET